MTALTITFGRGRNAPHKKWPPMGDVIDAVLNVGEQTFLYPSPAIYLEPVYQVELRRRAAIIKEFSGQDFLPAIDELVKQASKTRDQKP